MARYSGAQWRPLALNWANQPEMRSHDLILLHTMVGSLDGTDTFFRSGGYGGTESHFGVGGGGRVFQWQDTDYQAEANLQANKRAISIETEDRNTQFFPRWEGSNVPAWTEPQLDAIAKLVAWCAARHRIPLALIPDSLPSRRGIGYHRQGIDGSYRDGRVSNGEVWSNARGKVCPGDRRIAQIPIVIQRARRTPGVDPVVATQGGTVIPVILPRTEPPPDGVKADKWPNREETLDLGFVGGWRGRAVVRLSFGHPGGQVFRAHFDTADPAGAKVVNVPGVGDWPGNWVEPAYRSKTRWTFEAPAGATALMLTYAAPGGASLSIEWER